MMNQDAEEPSRKSNNRFSFGLGRRSKQPEISRSRASFIEDGNGVGTEKGSGLPPGSDSTPESRALALVEADESIASAARRRKSKSVSNWLDESAEVEKARQRIEAEAGHGGGGGGSNDNGHHHHHHHHPVATLSHSPSSSSSAGGHLPRRHSRSPSAAADQLLPADFDARTHPVEDLLSIASTLHTTSKSSPQLTQSGKRHNRSKSRTVVEDDPRLTVSTRLFAVLADRASTEGSLMYALALRAGWGVEPDEEAGLELLQSAVAEGLNELEAAEKRGGNGEPGNSERERALAVLRGALYELGNSFYHGLGAPRDQCKVIFSPCIFTPLVHPF
jgi:TPR repeat protein